MNTVPSWAQDRNNRRVVVGATYRDTFAGENTIFIVHENGPLDPETNTYVDWSELDLAWDKKTIRRIA